MNRAIDNSNLKRFDERETADVQSFHIIELIVFSLYLANRRK
jgi:hypothetical protein